MSRWFRVYSDLVDDPKWGRLGPDYKARLIELWCVCASRNGRVPDLDALSYKWRVRVDYAARLIKEFIRCGFIDETEQGLIIHNWEFRQYKSDTSAGRMKRHRERHRDVTVTPPDTETDTDTEKSLPGAPKSAPRKRSSSSSSKGEDDWPSDYPKQFWDKYPDSENKQNFGAMAQTLRVLRDEGVAWAAISRGLKVYQFKDDPKYVEAPHNWLRRRSFEAAPNVEKHGHQPTPEQQAQLEELRRQYAARSKVKNTA